MTYEKSGMDEIHLYFSRSFWLISLLESIFKGRGGNFCTVFHTDSTSYKGEGKINTWEHCTQCTVVPSVLKVAPRLLSHSPCPFI